MNELLPAFDFKAVLSSRAYAVVYAATQRSLDRGVAIKLLSPQASADPAFRSSFQANARAMASLNHPNLISLFDSGLVDGMLYFVSEFVPGKSLAHSLTGTPLEWQLALRLVGEIADGLEHAHRNDIVHGWLAPSDILLTPKAEPKIGNFGLGSALKTADQKTTIPAAPELLSGTPPDTRTDVFTLGAIFYELITGGRHSLDSTPPSTKISCPPETDAIWMKATHPSPALRFQSIHEFREALKPLLVAKQTGVPSASSRLAKARGNSSASRAAIPASPAILPANSVPASPPPPLKVGFNWTLVRNLVIITGLGYAISFAWDNYQKKSLENQELQLQVLAEAAAAKEKALADARAKSEELQQHRIPGQTAGIPGVPDASGNIPTPEISETPMESLERLKSSLAVGKRSELPKSTVTQGDNHYFSVKTPMTWPEAAEFAEQHGGHIAVPSQTANMQWLADQFFTEPGLWLGAGRSGRQSWTLADATLWKPVKEPTGTGQFLAVDKFGLLRAASSKSSLPFVIQWHNDGKNPGSLNHWLKTIRDSLATPAPIYPPGTRAYDNRHFLWVAREVTWTEADSIAEQSGGHLAAPASISEIAALEDLTRDLAPTNVLWLGGRNLNQSWQWVSGEPWKTERWGQGATSDAPDTALVIRPGSGWDSRKPSRTAKGFIIEWSADRTTRPANSAASSEASGASGFDLPSLKSKARDLLAATEQKRKKDLDANAKQLSWGLDNYLRNLSKSGQDEWEIHIGRIKICITDGRVPTGIPLSTGIKLSQKMADLAEYAAKKQSQIDEAFIVDATKLHAAYMTKLRDAKTQAQAAAKRNLVNEINEEINESSSMVIWCRDLGVEPRPTNPVPAARPQNDDGNFNQNGMDGTKRPFRPDTTPGVEIID